MDWLHSRVGLLSWHSELRPSYSMVLLWVHHIPHYPVIDLGSFSYFLWSRIVCNAQELFLALILMNSFIILLGQEPFDNFLHFSLGYLLFEFPISSWVKILYVIFSEKLFLLLCFQMCYIRVHSVLLIFISVIFVVTSFLFLISFIRVLSLFS